MRNRGGGKKDPSLLGNAPLVVDKKRRLNSPTGRFSLVVCLCTILGCDLYDLITRENDVFISFRGSDTRCGIVSHLEDALSRRQIKTFIDSELPRGQGLESIVKEIEWTSVAVVVFSEDYASSSWSLDELVRITECARILEMKVLPIFYKIDPSDVRNQNGSFQAAFERHENDLKDELHKVQRWRAALMEVSNLAGLDSNHFRRESDLVKKAVDDVARLLSDSRLNELHLAETACALFCIFMSVVILLCFKDIRQHFFDGGFISSVRATASILYFVFLGFFIRIVWILGTLDLFDDALPLSISRSNPRSPFERSVVIVFILLLVGAFRRPSGGKREADLNNHEDLAENAPLSKENGLNKLGFPLNNNDSNAHDEDTAENTVE